MSARPPRSCEQCAGPLADDQRYCLACGHRAIPAPNALLEARAWARKRWPARSPASTAAVAATPRAPAGTGAASEAKAPPRSAGSLLRIPSAPVCAVLIAAFVGFGVVLGSAAKDATQGALAASSTPRLKLVLPPSQGSTGGGTAGSNPSSGEGGTEAGGEAPAAEPEPASSVVTQPSHVATTPAHSTAPSGTSEASTSGGGEGGSGGSASGAAKTLPPIKHVFIVMLSDEPYGTVFGPASTAPYIAHTLAGKGEVLARYDAVAHEELPNEIALLSGQGPTAQTASNCPVYSDLAVHGSAPNEQVLGEGCVYPSSTQTLPGQLAAKHLTGRAYVEGMDEAGAAQPSACAHPPVGAEDPSAASTASTGQYATFRNPFVYFQSIAGSAACASDDVGLDRLASDLGSTRSTPALSYIVPDRCHDGNPTPCTPGAPAGLAPAQTFLQHVVPEIMRSAAYRQAGLLVITSDEAPSSGEYADSSSCCGQPAFPNLPVTGIGGHGGGTVGALLLSPYVKGGVTSQERFNHVSLLHTIESFFGLRPLGYAALAEEKPFDPGMFLARPARSASSP